MVAIRPVFIIEAGSDWKPDRDPRQGPEIGPMPQIVEIGPTPQDIERQERNNAVIRQRILDDLEKGVPMPWPGDRKGPEKPVYH
jgi:hypothetical protein